MKARLISLLLFGAGALWGGDLTITLVDQNPLTINIKGSSVDEEAASISFFLYFRDDGTTDLTTGNVNDSQIYTTWGWNSGVFRTVIITDGSWSRNGHTFTKQLLYDNADPDAYSNFWITGGINAVVCTFSPLGTGHAYIEANGAGAFVDWSLAAHNLTFVNQDATLPVQMGEMEAAAVPGEGIKLLWNTESETNSAGFHVWRSFSEDGAYKRISTAMVPSQGSGSSGTEYRFVDKNAIDGKEYWYK
ncbi:MAG TPA: hypothetical protein VGB38_07430, partial [bacterium]